MNIVEFNTSSKKSVTEMRILTVKIRTADVLQWLTTANCRAIIEADLHEISPEINDVKYLTVACYLHSVGK